METDKIIKAANILYDSRIKLIKIKELPKDCMPKSIEDAYSIQDELKKKYLSANDSTRLIGKKIACTNKAAQVQLNINESFSGNLFSDNISKSNTKINPQNYFSPFVEPEFAFIMKNELEVSEAPYTLETVYNSIDAVLPSIGITIENQSQGDFFVLSNITGTGFDIDVKDSNGNNVNRNFKYAATGFGRGS